MTKILVIDDEKGIASMLKDGLEFHRYKVEVATAGEEGVEKAIKFRPDIITLDLEMPDMNGFEVLARLKSDPRTRDVIVLLLTIRDEKEFAVKGFCLGAMEFMVKPFSMKNLCDMIENYTHESSSHAYS